MKNSSSTNSEPPGPVESPCRRKCCLDDADVCLGCGREHNCGIHGCAILRDAIAFVEKKLAEADKDGRVAVVHGRLGHLGGDEWLCTACGFVITTEGSWDKPTKKYCEDCGAKMDSERKDSGHG